MRMSHPTDRIPARWQRAPALLTLLVLLGGVAGQPTLAQSTAPATPAAATLAAAARVPESAAERMSYASGVSSVRNFVKGEVPVDVEMLIQGIRDAAAGGTLVMNEKDIRVSLNSLQADLRRAQVRNHQGAMEKNLKRGTAFQAEYKLRPGVKVLPNGVAYTVIKAGDGPKPNDNDSVVVRYRGTLIDGTEFDASEGDKTVTLRLLQTVLGWREALKAMPTGSTWQIVVPHGLAYGERGVGSSVGPNETLVFDIELVAVRSAAN